MTIQNTHSAFYIRDYLLYAVYNEDYNNFTYFKLHRETDTLQIIKKEEFIDTFGKFIGATSVGLDINLELLYDKAQSISIPVRE